MEKHGCKLCPRSFSNGRALGGHMRSHIAAPPPPPLPPPPPTRAFHHLSYSPPSSGSTSSSSSYSAGPKNKPPQPLVYTLRENPRKNFKFTDPESPFVVDNGGLLPDRESETESSRTPAKKTRLDSSSYSSPEVEPAVSSVSDHYSDEDVALCLMMLSKGKWTRRKRQPEFRCDLCDRVFPSHQALGGHRSGHRKTKNCTTHHQHSPGGRKNDFHFSIPTTTATTYTKGHTCPFCGKVFASGQALGGHKRSHLLSASSTSLHPARLIDLNLPAPEGDEVSEVLGGETVRFRS